jgi:hypothetical protein
MDNNENSFIEWGLIEKSLRKDHNNLTEEEQEIIYKWLSSSSKHRKFYDKAKEEAYNSDSLSYSDELDIENARKELLQRLKSKDITSLYKQKRHRKRVLTFIAAALVLSVIAATPLLLHNLADNNKLVPDILPGTQKATLITDKGEKINLGNSNETIDIGYANVQVNDNQIKYSPKVVREKEEVAPVMNTIVVPRGGEFCVTLPDGTKVWLNSESLLVFPDKFVGKSREVTVTGEVFFDVAKDPSCPFIIKTDDFNVRVTGTSFNINSYKTSSYSNISVESGDVIISTSEGSQIKIGTGQKLNVDRETKSIEVQTVEPGIASAWKDGWFVFDREPLDNIMEKVSRWYNIDVEISNQFLAKLRFSGKIERYKNANKVLDMLKDTEYINYSIEENVIKIY